MSKIKIAQRNSTETYGHSGAASSETSSLALVSLIFGILGWLLLPLVGSLTAVITGHMARADIRRTGKQGDGMAIAGLILGYLWWVLLIPILGILAAIALPAYQDYTHRAQAQPMHVQLDEVRRAIDGHLSSGVLPENINLDQEETLTALGAYGDYFEEAQINEAVLEVRYAHHESVPEPMRGEVLYIIPDVSEGVVQWQCTGSLHTRYQPGFCRD
ncbi:type II secretory pathway pseudopilin PulG [Neisseria sp. HSC-16F19]|nr:DUF4190 domain-containing protein [Neisseria sp. HSC-16F19]MCP2040317.1 type II secretory pathway pseudopilin PulG [Neisseria sp. HSC-16F19]